MDIDARRVNDGCVGIRVGAPPVLVMVYNTRALVLEDFVRLLRKLTERRKIGTAVRFRNTPEQALQSQRIECEQAAAMSLHSRSINSALMQQSAAVPKNVANVFGGLYMSATGSHTSGHSQPVQLPTCTSPGGGLADESPLKAALDVRSPCFSMQRTN